MQTRTIDLELSLRRVVPRWVAEMVRFVPFGYGNPRPTVAIRHLHIEPRSPRTALLTDGATRIAAKGRFQTLRAGERYDVVATPAMVAGELVLTVSDVRASARPSEPGRTSDTPYRHEAV